MRLYRSDGHMLNINRLLISSPSAIHDLCIDRCIDLSMTYIMPANENNHDKKLGLLFNYIRLYRSDGNMLKINRLLTSSPNAIHDLCIAVYTLNSYLTRLAEPHVVRIGPGARQVTQ